MQKKKVFCAYCVGYFHLKPTGVCGFFWLLLQVSKYSIELTIPEIFNFGIKEAAYLKIFKLQIDFDLSLFFFFE